jgi:hypothetical protein
MIIQNEINYTTKKRGQLIQVEWKWCNGFNRDNLSYKKHEQQHLPHEPYKLLSFSIYIQQCPSITFACIVVATIIVMTIGKLQVMVVIHSTLSLLDHQVNMAPKKAKEIEKWKMMQMGHLQT